LGWKWQKIFDTLHVAHEGVDKVRQSKIDILMAKLNRFVILENEGPQEIFDRLMVIVGKIRGLAGQDINDHKVVKIMLEAYSARNEVVVTLIRDKKRFDMFTPSVVLGRILTFDMQREEASEIRKIG
jgi:CRISPR/Cas system CMR-associated protein Cmr1 (group 7 of RAMP superfamily)